MNKCKHKSPNKTETELGTIYNCPDCGENITKWPRKLQNLWIKQRFYQQQGISYTSWVQGIYNTIQTGGILVLIFGGENTKIIAIWVFILAWLAQAVFETVIGHKDYTKWKVAQRQAVFSGSFSPTTVEMLRILNELRDKVCPELKKPSCLDYYKKDK